MLKTIHFAFSDVAAKAADRATMLQVKASLVGRIPGVGFLYEIALGSGEFGAGIRVFYHSGIANVIKNSAAPISPLAHPSLRTSEVVKRLA